jgi:hypothetical protein
VHLHPLSPSPLAIATTRIQVIINIFEAICWQVAK